jgi:methyl coenzyme M reductase subunit C-like uncharacterized protein (methanogenesis marker protein 7)
MVWQKHSIIHSQCSMAGVVTGLEARQMTNGIIRGTGKRFTLPPHRLNSVCSPTSLLFNDYPVFTVLTFKQCNDKD